MYGKPGIQHFDRMITENLADIRDRNSPCECHVDKPVRDAVRFQYNAPVIESMHEMIKGSPWRFPIAKQDEIVTVPCPYYPAILPDIDPGCPDHLRDGIKETGGVPACQYDGDPSIHKVADRLNCPYMDPSPGISDGPVNIRDKAMQAGG